MVSTLLVDVLPPLEPELGLELELEPAVQPAASMPAATMTPYLVRRLMPWSLLPFGHDLVRKGGCAAPLPARSGSPREMTERPPRAGPLPRLATGLPFREVC